MSVDSSSQKGQPRQISSRVFIGRERELRLLGQAALSPPSVAFVEGEAGIGKTRLLREVLSLPELEGRRAVVGHCHSLQEPFPFGPLIEVLQNVADDPPRASFSPVVGALRPLLPELADELPPQPEALRDPRAERHRVFRALRELLTALGPTVCVLEDMHWADEGTLEFLAFLWPQPPAQLALALTYRGEELHPSSPLRGLASRRSNEVFRVAIELSPLSSDEVRTLASGIVGTEQISNALTTSLHAQTAGLPFAVEEVLHLLDDRGGLLPYNGRGQAMLENVTVPPAVRQSILERLGRLSDDARLLTHAAAVVGVPTRESLMQRVSGLPPVRGMRALAESLSSPLLEEKGEALYGFRHALAAQAVYEGISPPERRLLHLRVARALEGGRGRCPLARLAHHFGGACRPRQCAHYAEAAAEAASSVGDDRTAARILEEALRIAGLSRAATRRMALSLGSAALFGRVPSEAIRVLRRVLGDDSLPRGLRGELRFSLARLLYLAGEASSHRELTQAAEELQRRPALAARAMAVRATQGPMEGAPNDRLFWLGRALEMAERQADPVVTTEILATRAAVLLEVGDPAGWRAIDDLPWSATSLEQRLELVRDCKYLASAALELGYYGRARSLLDEAERIREELDHGRFAVGLATIRSWLEWSSGRWEGLEARARSLMEANAEAPGMFASNELTLGWLILARGEVGDAERRFASVLDVVRNAQVLPACTTVTSGLATIQLARGDVGRARELATMGLERIGDSPLWVSASAVAPVAVDALIACGETADAQELVRRFARGLRQRDAPAAMARLAFCRGSVAEVSGRGDAARRLFAQAERGFRRLPCPYEAARARERIGRCLLAGDDARGQGSLIGALEEFEALGAAWDAGRVRAELRGHGVALPYPWRGGRRGYGGELSPREAEVARLVAMGSTNREIAGTLYISPRTVENHVASVLKKLELPSRKGIAQRFRQDAQRRAINE